MYEKIYEYMIGYIYETFISYTQRNLKTILFWQLKHGIINKYKMKESQFARKNWLTLKDLEKFSGWWYMLIYLTRNLTELHQLDIETRNSRFCKICDQCYSMHLKPQTCNLHEINIRYLLLDGGNLNRIENDSLCIFFPILNDV